MWFNPSELSENKTVHLATSATSATLATFEDKSSKVAVESRKVAEVANIEWEVLPEPAPGALMVDCYTPAGNAIKVEAKNPEHADFLKRMNPTPTQRNINP